MPRYTPQTPTQIHDRFQLLRASVLGALALTVLPLLSVPAVAEGSVPEGCDQTAPAKVPASRYEMTPTEFEEAAAIEFNRCHRTIPPLEPTASLFRPNVSFPSEKPESTGFPWLQIDPFTDSESYLRSVLNYALDACGPDHIDWDGNLCGWYHAPWMHELREPLRGLTRERSSRLGELHPSQTIRSSNWAVSMYNDVGGHAFHTIWGDKKAYPKTDDFSFAEGTVAVKLLFSLASPEQVPYLRYAKTWPIHDGEKVVPARLIQVDVFAKDDRMEDGRYNTPCLTNVSCEADDPIQTDDPRNVGSNSDLTGWIMGSYLYNGSIETAPRCDQIADDTETCEQGRWRERLVPIGLQWGNDPQMYDSDTPRSGETRLKPVQNWLNNDITTMFATGRTMSGHPPYLGRDGRMNGPVDNHRSTCLACHGRAVDFGRYEEDALRIVPFVAPDNASNEVLRSYFRNLDTAEPFLPGTRSLDYSLQAAVGIHKYRKWVAGLPLKRTFREEKTRDFTPSYVGSGGANRDIKIATWNIANLHHQTGASLRSDSVKRSESDFANIRKVIADLNADIIGLQEIGSITALRRVFDPVKYHLIMSDRYTPGDEFKPASERDIFTAFAVSKDAFPQRPKVTTLDGFSIQHAEYNDDTDLVEARPTRSAMGIEFILGKKNVSILNVHLKSGCAWPVLDPVNDNWPAYRRFDCRTLTAQRALLENWIEVQQALGNQFVVLGDFNRQLNAKKLSDGNKILDDFWTQLNDGAPDGLKLTKGPKGIIDKVCWKGNPEAEGNHIDFIVAADSLISEAQSAGIFKLEWPYNDEEEYPQYKNDGRLRLSDHCPVQFTLRQ